MEVTNLNKDRKNRRKPSLDLTTMVYGKIPPQAKELEEAVLGACLLEADAIDDAAEILQVESFYVDAHQRIFKALLNVRKQNIQPDILTVCEELRKSEELDWVGGPFAITKLTNNVVGTANLEAHARIIQQKFYAREIIRIAGEAIGEAYEDSTDVFDLMDKFAQDANKVGENGNGGEFVSMSTSMFEFHKEIDRKKAIEGDITGVPSGFKEIDKITHGWQRGSLITIAAGTADGKTAFSLNIATAAAKPPYNTCVAIFNLELPRIELINRIVSAETGIGYEKIITGKLTPHEEEKLHNATMYLESLPIFIDDTPGLNHLQIRGKLKRLMRKRAKQRTGEGKDPEEPWLAIADYVQLTKGAGEKRQNREEELADTTGSFKRTAKELSIPFIQLAQVNREVSKRKGFRLMLSDLRGSASIEMDSDIVMFIYKPDNDSDKMSRVVEIAKHRNGKLLTTTLVAQFWRQKFLNPEDAKYEPLGSHEQVANKVKEDFDEGFEEDKTPFK